MMDKRTITILVISSLFFSIFFGLVNFGSETLGEVPMNSQGANTLYVGGTGTGNYTKIQDAIDAASPGDTVFVYNGVYNSTLYINKSINLNGEDRNSTIINGTRFIEEESGGYYYNEVIIVKSNWVNISNFTITNRSVGVELRNSQNCIIENNNISDVCFSINHTNNNIIRNNLFMNNSGYIKIEGSSGNKIVNNYFLPASKGFYYTKGLWISNSNNQHIIGNQFLYNGIIIIGVQSPHFQSHTISNNYVNGKPLHYIKDSNNKSITNTPVGQIIIANSTDINIKNIQINHTDTGIQIAYSNNISVSESNISFCNKDGIYIFKSSNNSILGNILTNNSNWYGSGIYMRYSNDNDVLNNSINSNYENSINIINSHYNLICNNNISNNEEDGIYTSDSYNNSIKNNTLSFNRRYGIELTRGKYNTIENNSIFSNNFDGILIKSENNLIIKNYIHSNKEQYFPKEYSDSGISIWSPNNIIQNNTLINNDIGVVIEDLNNYLIGNLILSNRKEGIHLKYSSNSIISFNNISFNKIGIYCGNFYSSKTLNNTIFHNNFINNSIPSYDDLGPNFWNNSYPSGGNYWSDYSGVDMKKGPNQNQNGSDGIGDTPYMNISGNASAKDNYPLMKPVDIRILTPLVPFPPQDIVATEGDGYVNLSWTPPYFDGGSPIINYSIYRGKTSNGIKFYKKISNKLFYNDSNVTNFIGYYYKIRAINSIGHSQHSEWIYALPGRDFLKSPSKPINIRLKAGDGYIKLNWDPPLSNGNSSIIQYYIYRGLSSNNAPYYRKIGNFTYFNDTNVTNNITYFYKVNARNAIGEGPFSIEVNATPSKSSGDKPKTVPSYPRNLKAPSGNQFVNLYWDAPLFDGNSSILNYSIYRGTKSNIKELLTKIGDLKNFNDTYVTNGITYYYEVTALNIIGESPRSNEVIATPNASIKNITKTVPSHPLNFQASAGDGFINLTWEPPLSNGNSTISNYIFYKGKTSGNLTFYKLIGNFTSYNDTAVKNNITYYYRISAKNSVGEGPLSNEIYCTPIGPIPKPIKTIPSYPRNLRAVAGDGFVRLSWDAPSFDGNSSITNYRIYRSTRSVGKPVLITIGNILKFNDTNVTNGITYYYDVSAINAIGESVRSNEVHATPNSTITNITKTPPTAPRNLKATSGDGFVYLYWDSPNFNGNSTIINYLLYKGTKSGGELFYKTMGAGLFYNDTNVTNNVTYYYRVSAKNSMGEGALSNEISATPKGRVIQTNDSDNDNIPDSWELKFGLNASDALDATKDLDNDNLTNLEEYLNSTNPNNKDSDNDNLTDGEEIKMYNTNPNDPDSDGDGFNDGVEIENKTDPLNNNDYPKISAKKKKSSDDNSWIFGVSIAIVFVIVLLILMFLYIMKKKKDKT